MLRFQYDDTALEDIVAHEQGAAFGIARGETTPNAVIQHLATALKGVAGDLHGIGIPGSARGPLPVEENTAPLAPQLVPFKAILGEDQPGGLAGGRLLNIHMVLGRIRPKRVLGDQPGATPAQHLQQVLAPRAGIREPIATQDHILGMRIHDEQCVCMFITGGRRHQLVSLQAQPLLPSRNNDGARITPRRNTGMTQGHIGRLIQHNVFKGHASHRGPRTGPQRAANRDCGTVGGFDDQMGTAIKLLGRIRPRR
jgi:hypothetical protein